MGDGRVCVYCQTEKGYKEVCECDEGFEFIVDCPDCTEHSVCDEVKKIPDGMLCRGCPASGGQWCHCGIEGMFTTCYGCAWPSCENQEGCIGGCLPHPDDPLPDDPQSDGALVPGSPEPEQDNKLAESSVGTDNSCDESIFGIIPGGPIVFLPPDSDAGDTVIVDHTTYKMSKRGYPGSFFMMFPQRQTPYGDPDPDRRVRARSAPP